LKGYDDMARSTFDFTSSKSEDLAQIADKFLTEAGFKFTDYNGEKVYQKGELVGMLPPQFIKLNIDGNKVNMEAFVKNITGESDLKGIFGIAAKKPLQNTVNALIKAME